MSKAEKKSHDQKIDYLEFAARDLAATRAFFGAAFGWTFEEYGPDYLAFSDGRLDGGFFRADAKSTVATGGALVVFYADDLEATLEAVTKAGGSITKTIFTFPGGRRFHFEEPSGNEFAVWAF